MKEQIRKAERIGDCLNQTILRNRYLRIETKIRIYKWTIMTYHDDVICYVMETAGETSKTSQKMQAAFKC